MHFSSLRFSVTNRTAKGELYIHGFSFSEHIHCSQVIKLNTSPIILVLAKSTFANL